MSLFGALYTGVSALTAQSQSIGIISNNIANVSTVGYKKAIASFESLVTGVSRSTSVAPGGVRASAVKTNNQQGLPQQTTSGTDLAISGNGFFVVRSDIEGGGEPLFTRAGGFQEDSLGNLRNTAGFYLYGWRLDAQGNIPAASADVSSLQPVDVGFANGLAAPTSRVAIGANLQANDAPVAPPASNFSRAITVYDSLGESHSLDLTFRTTALNQWTLDVTSADAPGFTQSITLEFTGGGALATVNGTAVDPDDPTTTELALAGIDWDDTLSGASNSDITLDLSSLTQFAADYSVGYVEQNGAELGLRTGVTIDKEGFVTATFSNGQSQSLYKIPVATFANPNGLTAQTGEVFLQTGDSGAYNLREALTGGAGEISASSLEASNVDLADEFSRMIITQRAYSAGTKIVSTADAMLNELLSIR